MNIEQEIREIKQKLNQILSMMGANQISAVDQDIKLILASGGAQALKEFAKSEADKKRSQK
jgi:HPt (histidine-containing phosphotransfer) domain-containing protein